MPQDDSYWPNFMESYGKKQARSGGQRPENADEDAPGFVKARVAIAQNAYDQQQRRMKDGHCNCNDD